MKCLKLFCTWTVRSPMFVSTFVAESCLLNHERGAVVDAGTYPPASPPPPCQPAKNTTACNDGWHCATCRVGGTSASDCLSCAAGYSFVQGSIDCTGHCSSTIPTIAHERSTPGIPVGQMAGSFLSVVASLEQHRAIGLARASPCSLANFSVVATLIAESSR